MKNVKLDKMIYASGMVGVIFYVMHTIMGNVLWKSYNPITTDISTLTADGSPHAHILRIFTFLYGLLTTIFFVRISTSYFSGWNLQLKLGYLTFALMALLSWVGYGFFPLSENKEILNVQNIMHIVFTVLVVIFTILGSVLIAVGYRKHPETKKISNLIWVLFLAIVVFALMNPIVIQFHLAVIGLTERLIIYTIQAMIFCLSYIHYKGLVCSIEKGLGFGATNCGASLSVYPNE